MKNPLTPYSCPICGYIFGHCQCCYTGSGHPDRQLRRQVVLDNLHLLYPSQVLHLCQMEAKLQTSYGDEERSQIQHELEALHQTKQQIPGIAEDAPVPDKYLKALRFAYSMLTDDRTREFASSQALQSRDTGDVMYYGDMLDTLDEIAEMILKGEICDAPPHSDD